MDEMTEVRELRAGAPAPDRARLAPGRARLLDAARTGTRRHRVRVRPQFVIVGVAAAVTAVAVTASLLVGREDTRELTTPAAALTNADLKGMSAAELLERAAEAVERQPSAVEPKAKQWIYTKDAVEGAKELMEPLSDRARFPEKWIRYDGGAMAGEDVARENGRAKVQVTELDMENEAENGTEEDDGRSPRQMYRFLETLPTDAKGALKALRKQDAVTDEKDRDQAHHDYQEISALLRADLKPSQGLAGLYRALATLPHLDVGDHLVEDAAGRRAVALRYSGNDSGDELVEREWLIDPETYEVLGLRMIRGGELVTGDATVTVAVVDEPGERG
ncbi:CU044_5270 family protein [Streptomyces adelaidensis]|uniref:CU044_5270 family protein n=1 Tax=Streptomyces adelaidensis TaxID=2796465 RepID=UPI001905E102|nr:CU044_5270 family protein [Streptomyces adelaidensis]